MTHNWLVVGAQNKILGVKKMTEVANRRIAC